MRMTAHAKHSSSIGQLDAESSISSTHRTIFLFVLLMVILPYVMARLFIPQVTLLQTTRYAETSMDVSPLQSSQKKSNKSLPLKKSPNSSPYRDVQPSPKHADNSSTSNLSQDTSSDLTQLIEFSVGGCNIWRGKWVHRPSRPPYTNATCPFIQGHQDCLKNGRPDLSFLDWRWRPHNCVLPLFNAKRFFKLVKGKAWAFVGDSIARNHFQSVLCFLAQIEMPETLYRDKKDLFVRWYFPTYKFTLAVFWSPFLVRWTENEFDGYPLGIEKLWLDVADRKWASSIAKYDYVVLSGGQWFMKSSVYYEKNKVIGCHYVPERNLTQLGFYFGFRAALRTAFDFLLSSGYKGVVFFRTFTPDHFEGGQWHNGGHCLRTKPFQNASLDGVAAEMYKIQLEEFGRTLQLEPGLSPRYRIADTIHASLLRPDGHPGPYRNREALPMDGTSRVPQDCLHWCLPGAIDTWSAMILEMLSHLQ